MTIPPLSAELAAQLRAITPSYDGPLARWPCSARLVDGRVLPRVLVAAGEALPGSWRPPPRSAVPLETVVAFTESPERLPADLATQLYRSGETGMGYFAFRVRFRDGGVQDYVAGSVVDFIQYPEGRGPGDVVGLGAVDRERVWQAPDYVWVLFSGAAPL